MPGTKKEQVSVDISKVLDGIEKAVYDILKPWGFKKHGRTLHRFVSGDISQVVHFQLGQAYRGENHLLWVNVGIRVPECMTRSFAPEPALKKYYHEYECNMRSGLGEIKGEKVSCYDLRNFTEKISEDIVRQIQTLVIPAFEALNSRDAILQRRREFPRFDRLNSHLILLEESMIYGRRGEREKATEAFRYYYDLFKNAQLAQKDPVTIQRHVQYLDELAKSLGIKMET